MIRKGLRFGYGVTLDNFFASLLLSKELLQQAKTLTETIRKSRRKVPKEFIPRKNAVHSSEILQTKDAILVSYVPKTNKNVLLLSSMSISLT